MSPVIRNIFVICAAGLAGCNVQSSVTAQAPAEAQRPAEVSTSRVIVGSVSVETLASGLQNPWSLAFLPDGQMLVTERVGSIQRLAADGSAKGAISGVPKVFAEGQGGLLDVALSPTFATDSLVYLSYAEAGDGGTAGTAVARGKLEGDALTSVEVIFRQQPKIESRHHFGSRLVFDAEGHLFITMGERGQRPMAQDTSNHMGTIARIWPDGSVPTDNPFVDQADTQPEIWSFGHRNQQGAAINPWTGALWTHEHGPRGGDEINIPRAGKNYGWPLITHGIDYSGQPISEATGSTKEGLEQPHHFWEVSPGVSGMAFYNHPRFLSWDHNVFVGALAQRVLIRLQLEGDKVIGEERLLEPLKARIRDVRVGPDGAVYVLTDDINGQLLRVTPNAPSGS